MKGWKMILQANGTQKKVGVAILISGKNILQAKKVTRDKDGHYIMLKGTLHQEDLTVFHMLCWVPKYTEQLLTDLKWETDSNIIIVGNLTPPLHQLIGHSEQQSISALRWNIKLDELKIYTEYSIQIEYIFCLNTHRTFSRIDHMLRH